MSGKPRLLADEMLGKLARDLRTLGYDVAYARDVEDDRILEKAQTEDRLLVTRDRHLANRAGERGVLLETRDPAEQLERVIALLELQPSPEAFLSRCLECNEPVVEAEVPGRLPDGMAGEDHWRCPSCDRVYWRGTHVEDMLDRLGSVLPEGFEAEVALDPTAADEERKP